MLDSLYSNLCADKVKVNFNGYLNKECVKYCANLILFISLALLYSKCNINRENSPYTYKLLLKKLPV